MNRSSGVASGEHFWDSIASSSDGVNLSAISTKSGNTARAIFTSVNSGETWIDQTPQSGAGSGSIYWIDIASSADGRNLVAVASPDFIYQSTDFGKSWKNISSGDASGSQPWRKIASSADGQRLVALTGAGVIPSRSHLYTSEYGGSWKDQSPIKNDTTTTGLFLYSVSCSSDCKHLVATGQYATVVSGKVISVAKVFTSDDFGVTWKDRPIPKGSDPAFIENVMGGGGEKFITYSASSADGSRIAFLLSGSGDPSNGAPSSLLLTSADYGTTWSEQTLYPLDPDVQWGVMYELTSSSDGRILHVGRIEKTSLSNNVIDRWRMLYLTLP